MLPPAYLLSDATPIAILTSLGVNASSNSTSSLTPRFFISAAICLFISASSFDAIGPCATNFAFLINRSEYFWYLPSSSSTDSLKSTNA